MHCNNFQEDLSSEKKKNIISMLRQLNDHKLSEIADVIDIVLRFLASSGGDCTKSIHDYVTETLAIQRFLPKVLKLYNMIRSLI